MRSSPNMSYCQFENTLAALQQCMQTLLTALDNDEKLDFSSLEEKRAFEYMHQQCETLTDLFDCYADMVSSNKEESD